MNSVSDGAIRNFIKLDDYEDRAYQIVNEFFKAIRSVFGPEWTGMSPRTSRLKHGAGIVAMGFVMELLYSVQGATKRKQFESALELLKPHTAWTSGHWVFSADDICPWNGVQNTPSDIDTLATYLVRAMKRALRKPPRVANG